MKRGGGDGGGGDGGGGDGGGGRMTGGGWPGGLGAGGIAGGNSGTPGTSGAGGGVVTSPTGADGGGVPSPTLPSSSFCAWHTPTSSKSPQQSPNARQSRSQQHEEVHSPHTPAQLPGSSRSVACRVSACHAGFDATRSDRATPSSSRRRRRSPTSGAWPASPSHPSHPSSFRAIAPSETGAFSLPSPPTRARPGPVPPTPPRATDHAHDNTVRMTTAATPTRRRRVRPPPIRAHGSNAAFNAKSAKTPRKMRSPMRFSLTVNKHPSKQVPLGHVLIGSTEMGAPDLR